LDPGAEPEIWFQPGDPPRAPGKETPGFCTLVAVTAARVLVTGSSGHLGEAKAGEDPSSPLARAIGAKGYHDRPTGVYTS
jgi:hypothetical protein